jgi:hypothetical protein
LRAEWRWLGRIGRNQKPVSGLMLMALAQQYQARTITTIILLVGMVFRHMTSHTGQEASIELAKEFASVEDRVMEALRAEGVTGHLGDSCWRIMIRPTNS